MSNELADIREEIRRLHERTQQTKSNLESLKVLSEARNDNLVDALTKLAENYERINSDIKELSEKIEKLNILATSGKASIRTLLIVGGLISSLVGMIVAVKGNFF
jgi:predicted  nucleic acid-binding Zn-ribbon protein